MKTPLEHLLDCRVTKAYAIHDYHQLIFDSEDVLSIYNTFALDGVEGLGELVGRVVLAVHDSPEEVRLSFDDSASLHVDMRDEAYTGPEALVLVGPGESIIVRQGDE